MPHTSSSGRYYSPSPPPRRASRTDNFLDAVDRGRVRDAVGALRPGGGDKPRHRSHHHHRSEEYLPDDEVYYYHEEYDDAHPRSKHRSHPRELYYYEEKPTRHSRRKSVHTHRDSHSRSSGHHHGRDRARSESGPNWRQATEAAVGAGLIEGWRARHDPERVGRIATAAVGAAGTAMLVGREDDSKNKRHVTESTIGGLVLDRVINGSTKR